MSSRKGEEGVTAGHGVVHAHVNFLFGWLVVDGWCWFVVREEYCWLVAGG
jgi:hypothetical protein